MFLTWILVLILTLAMILPMVLILILVLIFHLVVIICKRFTSQGIFLRNLNLVIMHVSIQHTLVVFVVAIDGALLLILKISHISANLLIYI